jgi:hypothetical protein
MDSEVIRWAYFFSCSASEEYMVDKWNKASEGINLKNAFSVGKDETKDDFPLYFKHLKTIFTTLIRLFNEFDNFIDNSKKFTQLSKIQRF